MKNLSRKLCASMLLLTLSGIASEPDFYWSFNDSPDAVSADGKTIKPQAANGISFLPGIAGKALDISKIKELVFDAKNMFAEKGSISFWYAADFSGKPSPAVQHIFDIELPGGKSFPLAWFHIYEGLAFRLPTASEQIKVDSQWNFSRMLKDDWVHVAMTWGDRSWSTVYVNGKMVNAQRFSGVDFSSAVQFAIGKNVPSQGPFNGKIDELKIYKKTLSDADVFSEYAKHAVLDVYMDQTEFSAGKKVDIPVNVAPLGTLHGNNPVDPKQILPAKGSVTICLNDLNGKKLAEKTWSNISVDRPMILTLPSITLPVGEYRVEVEMTAGKKRMTKILGIYFDDLKVTNSDKEDITLDAPVFSCDEKAFSSTVPLKYGDLQNRKYAEGGTSKGDSLFCELEIPEKYTSGQLLCIEIEWPDDKPRAMGFYIYPPKGSGSQIRDRLGGGVYSGGAYPISGKLQKTTYFFHAAYKKYLFEIRTSVSGKPGAIAGISISPVDGSLPRLKINLPEGLPGRMIGHLDEDQSFDYNFDWDNTRPKLKNNWQVDSKVLRMLMEYYAYTGQNLISFPLMRYNWTTYQRAPSDDSPPGLPPFDGKITYWLNRLNENKIGFIAIINMMYPPEMKNAKLSTEYNRKNMRTASVDGRCAGNDSNNPVHPEIRKMFLAHITDFMSRIGKSPEITGIDFWMEWPIISFKNLEFGYDDYTVSAFAKETGVKVPEFDDDIFRKRHKYLTTAPVREKWIKWRADKTMEMIRAIRSIIDKESPGKPLYITIRIPQGQAGDENIDNLNLAKYLYEEKGVDIKAINALPNTTAAPMKDSLKQIWKEHWDGSIVVTDEAQNNPAFMQFFRRSDRNYVNSYRTYFETFSKSPVQDKYPSVFQNIELKPAGRYFLKELCLALAFNDAQRIAIGAQPLVSLGREKEMREFTKAYRALPDLPFHDIQGAEDPVTARYLQTKNETYFYAVNLIRSESVLKIKVPAGTQIKDLSSGENMKSSATFAVKLKPFELRSFLITGNVTPSFADVEIPETFKKEISGKIANLKKMNTELTKFSSDSKLVAERLIRCETLLKQNAFAEIDRLLNSKAMHLLQQNWNEAKTGLLQKKRQMLKQSHYGVNCGSGEYQEVSGMLFLPDAKWSDSASYGYTGNKMMAIVRGINNMPEKSPFRELCKTEVYAISGYKFRVEPGKYTIKLYQRVGYEPARKKDKFVMNISVNGKNVKKNYDVFAAESPSAGISELAIPGISPVNGVISVELTPAGERDISVAFLNGIELIKEKTSL